MKRISVAMLTIASFFSYAADSNQSLIEKGKYLAEMGDCYACHTIDGGEPYAGGAPFATPFGTVYSTNITPDKKEGIGRYSYQDFYDALHNGDAPGGQLYPAMPYTSYAGITSDDTKALFAYFQSIKPSAQKNKDNDMIFPTNIRFGMKFWNMLNLKKGEFTPTPGKSAQWNRGNYIVNTFGHCGECHTPRNSTMGMDLERHFRGAMIGEVYAPNITPQLLKDRGWGTTDVEAMLAHGYSRKGTVVGEMYTAIFHSLSKFNTDDLRAATIYLLDSDNTIQGKTLTYHTKGLGSKGHELYQAYCANCHGYEGEGKPNYAPGMQGNGTLAQRNHYNTAHAIMYGIKPQYYSQTNAFFTMPAFNARLSDEDLMHLLNYLTQAYTNNPKQLSLSEVQSLRKKVEESQSNATH
ncbi:c-type cytochrome [Vibrio sp. S4M6]|uniref:cytochrome c n=1 Tax=Vibrio sinus TaxID=2946865 RepID=UPI00202AA019|nr:c-type cytochrome [Vibrio sinus]MCL9779879.1 c-type cytochrome [Vibrio sinus]